MAIVHESTEVNVPLSQAYNQWTQFEDFPRFMAGVESITQLDDTTVHFRTKIAGLQRDYDARITQQIPDERVSWESIDAPRNTGTVWFEALTPTETRVNVELTWEPDSVLERAGAAVGLDSRQVRADLQRFKEFIEGREVETVAWRASINGGEAEGTGTSSGDDALIGSAPGLESPAEADALEEERLNTPSPTSDPRTPDPGTLDEYPDPRNER